MVKQIILILGITASSAYAHEISQGKFAKQFKGYNACFILYDLNLQRVSSEYNPGGRCFQRLAPDSTFKVALSLMAFNQGVISESSVFKWDGTKNNVLVDWNHDQTPASWLKYSVVWVSRQLTQALGLTTIQHYLGDFKYGNQDFSGDPGRKNGLTNAWLSSSLKISALEQLKFLAAMQSYQLPVSKLAIENTQKNMYQGKLLNGADYYGKTGSGRSGGLRDGWYIGFIESGSQQYLFVSNLSDKIKPVAEDHAFGSQVLKPKVIQLLNDALAN